MCRAVDIVEDQDRDGECAEDRYCRNIDCSQVMEGGRIDLAGSRVLREAYPREDQTGEEGSKSGHAFCDQTASGEEQAFRTLTGGYRSVLDHVRHHRVRDYKSGDAEGRRYET